MSGKLSPEGLDVIRAAYQQRLPLSPSGFGLFGHIDALQAENAALRAELLHWKSQSVERGSCSGCDFCDPLGGDS